jgi:hypothetical protein
MLGQTSEHFLSLQGWRFLSLLLQSSAYSGDEYPHLYKDTMGGHINHGGGLDNGGSFDRFGEQGGVLAMFA